jgi:hypothetical protein
VEALHETPQAQEAIVRHNLFEVEIVVRHIYRDRFLSNDRFFAAESNPHPKTRPDRVRKPSYYTRSIAPESGNSTFSSRARTGVAFN